MARTRIEIDDELAALRDLQDKVPATTTFGDNNHAAVEAQIDVIEERLGFEEAVDRFEEDGDYIQSAALDAVRWLWDDDEPVSDGWRDLVVSQVEAVAC